ncbi:MAG: peptidoglycan-binding domain-containing protein [Nitrospirota bacterium]
MSASGLSTLRSVTSLMGVTGMVVLMGCASGPSPDILTERLLSAQARLQDRLDASQKAYTESIGEALGTAKSAHQKATGIEASVAEFTGALKDVKSAMETTQRDLKTLGAQLKSVEASVRAVADKTDQPKLGDPDMVTLQLRVPPGPLRRGQKGADILALHRALHLAGMRVEMTEQYTKETEQAVKTFQRIAELPGSGLYDQETASRLKQALEGKGPDLIGDARPGPAVEKMPTEAIVPARPIPVVPTAQKDQAPLVKPVVRQTSAP